MKHAASLFVFKVTPTAKVIWSWDHVLKVSSDRMEEPGIKLSTPGYKAWFIHYATPAPWKMLYMYYASKQTKVNFEIKIVLIL